MTTTTRPWGHYEVLAEQASFKLKRIVVNPGHRLSLQRHRQRDEHWYVLEGRAFVDVGGAQLQLITGQSVNIAAGTWHRLANTGDAPMMLIEIQSGGYFGEDDIERRDDDYGRADAPSRPPP
jgi:mannose-6-phosphate isomerase-like protein (cupin superfamily)